MEHAKYFDITKDQSMFTNPERLANVGKHQLHLLGRQLRYKHTKEHALFSNEYQSNEIVFRSTGFNRDIESAESFLSGFYQPGIGPILRKELTIRQNQV